jgi:NitT/TauT family transport system substrate-binding protein
MKRRSFVQGATVTALAAATPAVSLGAASAQDLTKVRLTLPWVPDAFYGYAYVAVDQGFWRKRGLDVTLSPGTGSMTAAQGVVSGQFDFGVIATSTLIQLAAKGLPLVGLGIIDYNATMGVGLLADSPIRKPKDLEGKRVAQTLASADAPYFAAFAKKTGIDLAKVQLIAMDPNIRNRALIEKQVDAITGIADAILPTALAAGVNTRFMLYGDYGLDFYGNCLISKSQALAQKPKICQAVFDGLMEGVAFQMIHPQETVGIFLRQVPETAISATSRDYAKIGVEMLQFSVLSEKDILQHGFGWGDPKKLDTMIDLVLKYQTAAGTARPARSAVFPLPFKDQSKATAAQWAAAQQNIAGVSKALRAT